MCAVKKFYNLTLSSPHRLLMITFLAGTLRLEANRLQDRVVEEICALRDVSLQDFVVDCPIDINGENFGVVCTIPECCTSCEPLLN